MNTYLEVLKKYTVFTGRARRKEYWTFTLINFLIFLILSLLAQKMAIFDILSILYMLAVLLPGLGVSIRRLHDTDRSGWWLLLGLIPLIGSLILLIFMIIDSQPGSNQYGPNPKGV